MFSGEKKRIAIFASGAGSNAKKIIEYFRQSHQVEVAMILCNNPSAGVISIAEKNQIPCTIIQKKEFLQTGYADKLQQNKICLIVLAGFLWKIPSVLIHHFPGRIINLHPALLPKYGGKGMYGMAVHSAVIKAGEPFSGITIHIVDEEYDHGKIIFQKNIPVAPGETPESLAKKIHELEHQYLPATIEKELIRIPF